MSDIVYKAMSWLYTIVAVTILSLWSVLMVVALSAEMLQRPNIQLKDKGTIMALIAVPSLLTFLICKIIVAVFPERPRNGSDKNTKTGRSGRPRKHNAGNMIQWIATAGDGSPQGSLVLLVLSGTWLLQALRTLLDLIILSGFVIIWTTQVDVNPPEGSAVGAIGTEKLDAMNMNFLEAKKNATASLNEFKATSGIDLVSLLDTMSSSGLVIVMGNLWMLLVALVGYIIAQAVSASKVVLTSPKEAWTGRKDEAEPFTDRKTSEVASEVI